MFPRRPPALYTDLGSSSTFLQTPRLLMTPGYGQQVRGVTDRSQEDDQYPSSYRTGVKSFGVTLPAFRLSSLAAKKTATPPKAGTELRSINQWVVRNMATATCKFNVADLAYGLGQRWEEGRRAVLGTGGGGGREPW